MEILCVNALAAETKKLEIKMRHAPRLPNKAFTPSFEGSSKASSPVKSKFNSEYIEISDGESDSDEGAMIKAFKISC